MNKQEFIDLLANGPYSGNLTKQEIVTSCSQIGFHFRLNTETYGLLGKILSTPYFLYHHEKFNQIFDNWKGVIVGFRCTQWWCDWEDVIHNHNDSFISDNQGIEADTISTACRLLIYFCQYKRPPSFSSVVEINGIIDGLSKIMTEKQFPLNLRLEAAKAILVLEENKYNTVRGQDLLPELVLGYAKYLKYEDQKIRCLIEK